MNSVLTSLLWQILCSSSNFKSIWDLELHLKPYLALSCLCDKFSQSSSGSLNGDPMIEKTSIPSILLCMNAPLSVKPHNNVSFIYSPEVQPWIGFQGPKQKNLASINLEEGPLNLKNNNNNNNSKPAITPILYHTVFQTFCIPLPFIKERLITLPCLKQGKNMLCKKRNYSRVDSKNSFLYS